ncbi:hypothetical protein LEP1GSC185_0145 [Leptospira licerasiae serovar Varillal str. VAR 010]|nr:hypothetical protein LEP1GSC185_0145 [Leptospira licerasiae serovar Varillal str. VAR 010]
MKPGSHPVPYFIKIEEEGGLGSYCRYNPLVLLPIPGFNILNPIAWPCAGVTNYADNTEKSVIYKEKVREEIIRKLASENGANIVFMFKVKGDMEVNILSSVNHDTKTSQQSTIVGRRTYWEIHAIHVSDKSYFKTK